MLSNSKVKTSLCAKYIAPVCFAVMALTPANANAGAELLTGKIVLDNMNDEQQFAYLSGIVEGLAYARYEAEGKKADGGMKCIYDWFYRDKQALPLTVEALHKFETKPVNAIVAAMIEQKCGK